MLRASNEKNFRRIICPPRFIVIALIISDVRGGGRISRPLPPPVPEGQNKKAQWAF